MSYHLLWHESNGAVAEDGAKLQMMSLYVLVIFITSIGDLLTLFDFHCLEFQVFLTQQSLLGCFHHYSHFIV